LLAYLFTLSCCSTVLPLLFYLYLYPTLPPPLPYTTPHYLYLHLYLTLPHTTSSHRECEIKGVHGFGVFVEVLPGHEGLVHVSELDTKRVNNPEAAGYAAGQKIDVKCLGKNDKVGWVVG
jgi:hypothetical protein